MLEHLDLPRLFDEMVAHFSHLIQINSVNPPGNEIDVARYIASVFDQEGISYEIIEPEPTRASIIARIKGNGTERPLLLMSHLDVVAVENDKWDMPPFSGTIKDDVLWGRGALDCKNTVSLWMMVMVAVKRSGWVPKRDLIFLGAADEETGGRWGAKWIAENRYDLVDAEAALNEGGGFGLELDRRIFYTYQTGEKGNLWLRITKNGTPGHASIPNGENPVSELVACIERLQKQKLPFRLTPSVQQMIATLCKSSPFFKSIGLRLMIQPLFSDLILRKGIKNHSIASSFRAMLRNTVSPTVLQAGQKVNVIPSEAQAEVDFRILPGFNMEHVLQQIKQTIGPGFQVDVTDLVWPSESPPHHPLARCISAAVQDQYPAAQVVPLLLPGSTDGGFFRAKGMVVYGFSPILPTEDTSLAHSHNERIGLDSVRFSLEVGLKTVIDFIS